jgi:hypothetical protein
MGGRRDRGQCPSTVEGSGALQAGSASCQDLASCGQDVSVSAWVRKHLMMMMMMMITITIIIIIMKIMKIIIIIIIIIMSAIMMEGNDWPVTIMMLELFKLEASSFHV